MQSYVIHFIRHGMTEANVKGQYAGAWDVPLCDEGIKKLNNLKSNYEYPKAQEYYSSSLSRCVDTCKILYGDVDIIKRDNLKECSFGDWEGKNTEFLLKDAAFKNWMSNNDGMIAPPNGESNAEFAQRICMEFENIVNSMIKRGVKSSCIFTHGGVIMMILSMYGLPQADYYDWIVDNGCGYSIRITPSLWMRDKVVEVYSKVPEGSSGEISGEFKNLIDTLSSEKGKEE